MPSLGTRRVELKPIHMNSPGDTEDDKLFRDTVPVEDVVQEDDVFDTQVVDYDDNDLTQLVDYNEDTQIRDLAGETQVMDQLVDYNEGTQIKDLAGETQVMDDYGDDMSGDTQLLDVSDCETESDKEGAGRTQLFNDTVQLNEIELPDRINNHPDVDEKMRSCGRQDEEGVSAKSLPLDDATHPSGSLRRGFASVRTASLRAAGLAARKMASKNAENGSSSTTSKSGCSKSYSVNDDVMCTGKRDGLEIDIGKHIENGLGNGHNTDGARSLARKLFIEEEVAEEGSNSVLDFQKENFSQLPGTCDNELAGLSYVDSQEPGELSQANALDFVDKFLKVNLLEPDEDVVRKNTVSEIVTPLVVEKGTNSIARDASRRSRLASASVFEWDDNVEDEGGGEFFIKKKELLVGNGRVAEKSSNKNRTSRHSEAKGNQSSVKNKRKEQQNVHDTIMGFLHSDSKLLKGRKASHCGEIDIERRGGNSGEKQSHLDDCDRLALEAPPNTELAEMLDVGIDTQMAAEAMEALSTATAIVENSSSRAGEGMHDAVGRGERGKTTKKRRSAQKEAYVSNPRVVTRSQCKSGNELRPHSQNLIKKREVDLVKPRVKRTRLCLNNTSGDHKKESSNREPRDVNGMRAETNPEELRSDQLLTVKRRSSRKKESTKMPTQVIALNQVNCAVDGLSDSSEGRHCLTGVHTRKRTTRSGMASVNINARVETANRTIVGDKALVDGSSANGRDVLQTCDQSFGSGKNAHMTAYGANDFVFGSIARRTRSKRSAQSAHCRRDEEGLPTGALLTPEKASNLLLEKQAACSPSSKGIPASASFGGSSKKQKLSCSVTSTPDNLRTPGKVVSPIVMGDEIQSPSCKKNLFLRKECSRLIDSEDCYSSPFRVLRQRRDMNNVQVLFSQHLGEDIVRHQRKILSRLGFSEASSVLEATHFVADIFMRTRNMLEAIANAKLVVTHQWLESCGQANCFIDEKKYILRDIKKEKELGFSMPMSLARASRHPLLEGRRVLVTPNIKPSKDVISGLVKSVQGQAIGRMCRSTSNNDKLLEDLLILSCEEDFEVCLPLLERGVAVYSSELLLNGIITQRLEYERHRLFATHVKKTRSNLWLKKEGDKFIRVRKAN